jgi:SAM-dependent methyltransferase
MTSLDRPKTVAREYATLERLAQRRLDRSAWLRGEEEPCLVALRAIAEVRPRRVLDAGCGTGEFATLIAAPEVVAIDLSLAAIEAARSHGLDARVADIRQLPFADADFDVVTCNWVLYHLPDTERGLAEIARVLRSGGRFVGIYNAPDHMSELWTALGHSWEVGFDCERGPRLLARHYARVEQRDARTEASWDSREALQGYLDGFRELVGPLDAPDGPYPFRVSRHNCVLIADKG